MSEVPDEDIPEEEGIAIEAVSDAEMIDLRSAEEIRVFEEAKSAQRAKLDEVRLKQQQDGSSSASSTNAEKRLAYLMAQSEVFTQFLYGSALDDPASGAPSMAAGGKKGGGGGRRTRMTEDAEDKQMLKAAQSSVVVTRLLKQPSNISGTMRPYQLEGLNWLIKLHDNAVNGILADEMGLGKTLQTISVLAYLRETRKITGPHLVIVPKSTVSNWMREFTRWCPSIRSVRLLGDKAERARVIKEEMGNGKFDVCVASYESMLLETRTFLRYKWKYVVIDEAHRIKNEKSSLSKIVRMLKSDFRLLITGTPLQNNLHELWALCNFLMPEMFGDSERFDEWFTVGDKSGLDNIVRKLHALLKPFVLRRVKSEVEKDLPPKRETKLYIGLSALQRSWYSKLVSRDLNALNDAGTEKVRLLNILMQLRKVCNHPYLFDGAEAGPPYTDGPHLWESSGKLTLIHKLLPKLQAQGSRVLIFSQMTRMLDILEDYLRIIGFSYCRIDGSTSGEDRDTAVDSFNKPGSDKFCFLLSTRAGGLGINLQTADTVILYDSDWNPQVDLQAMDRAHRIGQTKEVRVFRFITEGTVEEKVVERADRKLFLDAAVIQQGRMSDKNTALSKSELMTMVRFGADEIIKNAGVELSDEDIDAILARSEERTAEVNKLISTQMQHNLNSFSISMMDEAAGGAEKGFNLFTFEGETYDKKKKPVLPFLELVAPRERKADDKPSRRRTSSQKGKPKKEVFPDWQFFGKEIYHIQQVEDELIAQQNAHLDLARRLKSEGAGYGKGKKNRRTRVAEEAVRKKEEAEAAEGGDDDEDEDDDDDEGGEEEDDDAADEEGEDEHQAAMQVEAAAASAVKQQENQQKLAEARRLLAEVREGKFNLPPDMALRKQQITESAFVSWTKPQFKVFVEGLERNGYSSRQPTLSEVALETGKTEAEVDAYFTVFMARYLELCKCADIKEKMDKGEKRRQREVATRELLERKAALGTPVQYGNKGRFFSEEEDSFFVQAMHRFGYGSWDRIRVEIRRVNAFRYNFFFQSRSAKEIQSRCEQLVKLVEKELEPPKEKRPAAAALEEDGEGQAQGGGDGGGGGGRKKKVKVEKV